MSETLEKARKRFTMASDAEQENRDRAKESIDFTVGNQWDDDVVAKRKKDELPCLVFNQCDVLVSRVAGGIINDIPLLTVIPEEEDDLVASRSIHKIIKHIERTSDAESIYQNAEEDAIDGGFGYFRILTRFSNYDTFEQEIYMEHIKNRFNVYLDPGSDKDTYEDGEFCFITETMEREKFKDKYGEGVDQFFGSDGNGTEYEKWFFDDTVRVAEYFWKEPVKKTKLNLVNLLTGKQITVDKNEVDRVSIFQRNGYQILDEQETDSFKIMWGKMIGDRFIEGPQEFPSDFIPVVKVIGKEKNVKGKRQFFSLIEFVKAPQRLLNYSLTTEALLVGMQPKATWISPHDLVEDYEDVYRTSHHENTGLLMYKRNPQFPGDKPELIRPPASSQGYLNLIQFAESMIENTSGITEAFLGKKSNEVSGTAIRSRAAGSQMVTSVFGKNLLNAITYGGKIMISMIGHIYKEPNRVLRVLGENDGFAYLSVNETILDDDGEIIILNDISKNKYDYVVEASSRFKTKRRENVANFMQMLQLAVNNPAMQTLLASQVIRNMDVDNAVELADQMLAVSGLGTPQGSPPNVEGNQQEQAGARATAVTPS